MNEQLRDALVSRDVRFVKKLLKTPSEVAQPPVSKVLSAQLLQFKWPLQKVVNLGETELTRLFLRASNGSMNVDGALHRAVYNFDVDHVRLFLQEFDADPNSFDEDFCTPIDHLYTDGYERCAIYDEQNSIPAKAVYTGPTDLRVLNRHQCQTALPIVYKILKWLTDKDYKKLLTLIRKLWSTQTILRRYINSIYYNRLLRERLRKASQIIKLRGKVAFVVGKLMKLNYNYQNVLVDIVLQYLDLADLNTLVSLSL